MKTRLLKRLRAEARRFTYIVRLTGKSYKIIDQTGILSELQSSNYWKWGDSVGTFAEVSHRTDHIRRCHILNRVRGMKLTNKSRKVRY